MGSLHDSPSRRAANRQGLPLNLTLSDPPDAFTVAGDWHANTEWAIRTLNHSQDTIIHVGDFGYTFSADFIGPLERALRRTHKRLYFIDGNHDNHEHLAALPTRPDGTKWLTSRIRYLPRGLRWNWHGVNFLALGGAYSVDRRYRTKGVSWWEGETISLAEAESAAASGSADVMFTHDCPADLLIPGLEKTARRIPSDDLKEANGHRQLLQGVVDAVRPKTVYCGHFHQRLTGYLPATDTIVEVLDCDNSGFKRNLTHRLLDPTTEALNTALNIRG